MFERIKQHCKDLEEEGDTTFVTVLIGKDGQIFRQLHTLPHQQLSVKLNTIGAFLCKVKTELLAHPCHPPQHLPRMVVGWPIQKEGIAGLWAEICYNQTRVCWWTNPETYQLDQIFNLDDQLNELWGLYYTTNMKAMSLGAQ